MQQLSDRLELYIFYLRKEIMCISIVPLTVRALTMLTKQPSSSDDDLSPMQPLPLVQQRENYLV